MYKILFFSCKIKNALYFFTVTSDDKNNFRIVVHSTTKKKGDTLKVDFSSFCDNNNRGRFLKIKKFAGFFSKS